MKNLLLFASILTFIGCFPPKKSNLIPTQYTTEEAYELLNSRGFIEGNEKRNYNLDKLNELSAIELAGIIRAIPSKVDGSANFFIKMGAFQLTDTAQRNSFIRHYVITDRKFGKDLNLAVTYINKSSKGDFQNLKNVLILLDKDESIDVLAAIGFAYGQTGSDGGFNGKYSFNIHKADHWPADLLSILAENILNGDPNRPEKNISTNLKEYLEDRAEN